MTKAELYKKACMLPLLPGVYIIRDKSGTIIYIGKAKRLRIRVSQYFREGVPHDNKVSQMIAHAYAFDVIVCQSEFEALVLEASQIKAHTPKYNILLKDDKGYSYIKVTKDEWPRLSFTLQKEDDGAEYIGPYTSSFAARQMAETAMDAFLLPRCSRRFPQEIGRGRPCLNAHIGKCMAVCSGKISRENYEQAVKSAVHLIRYGKKDILKTLNERMLEASDRHYQGDGRAEGRGRPRRGDGRGSAGGYARQRLRGCPPLPGGAADRQAGVSVPRHRRHRGGAGGISAPVLPRR